MSARRRRDMAAARLSEPGDGRAPAAVLALLQNRAQAAQRLGALALEPAPLAEGLHEAVAAVARARLDGQRDPRRAARGGLEVVDAADPRAVVLAAPPGLDDAPGRVDLDE